MEASPFPGHVVASLEISGVQIQVYEGADTNYAASTAPGGEVMLNDFTTAAAPFTLHADTRICGGELTDWPALCSLTFQLDPFQKMLFLFCGRRQDRIKGLYWEETDFSCCINGWRTEAFQWPRNKDEVRQLTPQQYRWLMEGLKTEQPKANKAVSGFEHSLNPKRGENTGFLCGFVV